MHGLVHGDGDVSGEFINDVTPKGDLRPTAPAEKYALGLHDTAAVICSEHQNTR